MILFSACGKSADVKNDSSSATSGTGQAVASTAPEKTPKEEAEPVTLNFMAPGVPKNDGEDFWTVTMPKLVNEKFSNISVNSEMLPDEQYITTLKARMAAGEGPDIYMFWASKGLKELIDAGYAKDITGSPILKDFNEGVVKAFTFDGKVYAVPQGVIMLGTYYNKDLFKKAGIETLPQDWPSFLDACKKLKSAGITPIVMGDRDWWYIQFGLYQIAANVIPDFIDYDNQMLAGGKHFTDPEWTKAFEMYYSLYKEGYVMKGTLGIGGAQVAQLFIDGKAAMVFDGTWALDGLVKEGAAKFERGFFALPANEPGKPTVYSYSASAGFVTNPESKNPDAVNRVMEYWMTKGSPLFKSWREKTADIPAIKGETFNKEILNDAVTNFQNSPSAPFCNNNWPEGVAEFMCKKFQELIAGKVTPADVAKTTEAKLREVQAQKK